jgi:hypothetical protein
MRMDADGCGWMRMDADGFGWIRMDVDGWMWTEVSKYRSTLMNIEEIGACI